MRNFSKAMFLGLILTVALGAGTAFGQCAAPGSNANINYTLHEPTTQTLYNGCVAGPGYDTNPMGSNLDPMAFVTLGGEIFHEYHCEQKANGDYHLHWTSHFNVTGTDSHGVKYVGKDSQSWDQKADPDGTTVPPNLTADFRTSDKFKLIAQGPTPDMIMTSTTHVRWNAAGTPTVDVEKGPTIKCK